MSDDKGFDSDLETMEVAAGGDGGGDAAATPPKKVPTPYQFIFTLHPEHKYPMMHYKILAADGDEN